MIEARMTGKEQNTVTAHWKQALKTPNSSMFKFLIYTEIIFTQTESQLEDDPGIKCR